MFLAPTRVEWPLDARVREVTLEFGFDPVAYERGTTNGAEVIVELVYLQKMRTVYRRLLDPRQQPNDRGTQSVLITLPPFPEGSRLIVRTDPGASGDNAWDWVYVSSLQMHRSEGFITQQFPGFNRVPDSADAVNSKFLDDAGGRFLLLHAPGSLTYLLRGDEHRLSFAFGFLPGAYADGGRTDGAVFRVEWEHPGQPVKVLFERFLQPLDHPADRGRQLAELLLPAVTRGDRLTISIDPGPAGNDAWDWTYLTNLTIE